uniref:F-box domain-containing protein n=1 Tax=Pristionchus pacificus TaxID=54126 RepID=A0A8R1YHK9_PRIPA
EWYLRFEMEDFEPAMQLSVDAPIDTGDMVLPDELRTELNAGLDKLSIESGDAMGCVKLTVKEDFVREKNTCPFLSLPKEILRLIFKNHLSAADRLRARLTTGLWEIEAEESYAMRTLNIVDDVDYYKKCNRWAKMQQHDIKVTTMTMTKPMDVYVDGLAKLTAKTTYDTVLFKIDNPAYGDLLTTVAEIPVPQMFIDIEDEATRTRLLTTERVEQLVRGRKTVGFYKSTPCLTDEMLLRFYEGMESGADPLRELTFYDVPAPVIHSALSKLGLNVCGEGHLHSDHRKIEVYLWTEDYFIIVDDSCIVVQAPILTKGEPGLVSIERWEMDGSKGTLIFSKEEIREYLHKVPVIYADGRDDDGGEADEEEVEVEVG